MHSLPRAIQDGKNFEAREELLLAANFAMSAETGRHLGHVLAHAVGGYFHLAHGHACALALPPVVREIANVKEIQRELNLIADCMDLERSVGSSGEKIAKKIEDLNNLLGIQSLQALGHKKDEISYCIPRCLKEQRNLKNSLIATTEYDLKRLLLEMY